jgi:hypothetical protein
VACLCRGEVLIHQAAYFFEEPLPPLGEVELSAFCALHVANILIHALL